MSFFLSILLRCISFYIVAWKWLGLECHIHIYWERNKKGYSSKNLLHVGSAFWENSLIPVWSREFLNRLRKTPRWSLTTHPGEKNGNPLQYSCLEKSHECWSLGGYSLWGHKESDMTECLTLSLFPLSQQCLHWQCNLSWN